MQIIIAFLILSALIITVAISLRSSVVDGWEDSDGFHTGVKP